MKQVIQSYKTGKIELLETPVPKCAPGMVLVRTSASLVSIGTERRMIALGRKNILGKALARPDLVRRFKEKVRTEGFGKTFREAMGRLDAPTALGYSSAGVIVQVGEGVVGFGAGDRVACMGAGFAPHAEYALLPQKACAKVHADIKLEEAAFGTVGTIALHGIHKAKVESGEAVAVIGLGLIGLITAQILKAYGCEVFGFDVSAGKVGLAKKIGLSDAYLDADDFKGAIRRRTSGGGVSAVIIAASTQSLEPVNLAIAVSGHGARVVIVGVVDIHPNRQEMWEKEVLIVVSKAGGRVGDAEGSESQNLREFLRLLEERKIDVGSLISHRFKIEEAEEVYARIIKNEDGPYVGVIFTYGTQDAAAPRAAVVKNPEARKSTADVSLGVIGAGVFGRALFLPNLGKVKNIRLHTLATASGANARYMGAKYGFENFTADYTEVVKNNEINGVIILAPHRWHAKMVMECLKAGKHVLVEKPLCVTEQELEAIRELYKGLPVKSVLSVGYNRRFSPLAIKLKDFFEGRRDPIVAHYRVNAGFVPKEHWVHTEAEGGGRIIGEAGHFVDFLQFAIGSNPVRVSAERVTGNDKTALANDNFAFVLKFADGSIGSIVYTASGDRAFSRERVELFSEEKTAALTDFKTLEFFRNGRKRIIRAASQELGHLEEIRHFVERVRGGAEPLLTAEEIFASTQTIFKVCESLETGEARAV